MRIKRKSYKLTAAVIAAFTLLTGCGSNIPDGYYVLDSVKEGNNTVSKSSLDSYGLDGSYLVMEGGKGYIYFLDTPEEVTYDNDKGVLKSSFGNIAASVSGNTLTLADGTLSMSFTKSKDKAPEKPDYPDISGVTASGSKSDSTNSSAGSDNTGTGKQPGETTSTSSGEKTPLTEFWNGYWFGYWEVNSKSDLWDDLEGYKFALFGKTSLDDNGNGEIYLWDNDYDLADVICSNNGYGLTEFGTMISESGYFLDGDDLEHADWNIDPGLLEHKDSFWIDGRMYYNDELQFDYDIRLVKWGSRWEDFDKDELPDEIQWYLEQIDSGITDPSSLIIPEE